MWESKHKSFLFLTFYYAYVTPGRALLIIIDEAQDRLGGRELEEDVQDRLWGEDLLCIVFPSSFLSPPLLVCLESLIPLFVMPCHKLYMHNSVEYICYWILPYMSIEMELNMIKFHELWDVSPTVRFTVAMLEPLKKKSFNRKYLCVDHTYVWELFSLCISF